MIYIGAPRVHQTEERAFLSAQVTLNGRQETAWFSTELEYASYLTEDRCDAFVLSFLTTAMRLGEDIHCEAPLTARLLYQLNTYLIPSMAANMEIYHSILVHAPTTHKALPCAKAVGTGWTGGVDCMYTLMTHMNAKETNRRLTHLLVANVGTLESDNNTELLQYMGERARGGIAADMGISVITIDSNIQLLQSENYLAVAVFRLPAAVLAVQKLFGAFLHSGAYEFDKFTFDQGNSAYYELLPLTCFETDCTVFYSTGSHISRMQKLEELSSFPYAQKYLHPCIYAKGSNCGQCGKCVRTMGALYALGTLNRFNEVFDTDHFYRNTDSYLVDIFSQSHRQHYKEVVDEMERRGVEISPDVMRKVRIMRTATMMAQKHSDRLKDVDK